MRIKVTLTQYELLQKNFFPKFPVIFKGGLTDDIHRILQTYHPSILHKGKDMLDDL